MIDVEMVLQNVDGVAAWQTSKLRVWLPNQEDEEAGERTANAKIWPKRGRNRRGHVIRRIKFGLMQS